MASAWIPDPASDLPCEITRYDEVAAGNAPLVRVFDLSSIPSSSERDRLVVHALVLAETLGGVVYVNDPTRNFAVSPESVKTEPRAGVLRFCAVGAPSIH